MTTWPERPGTRLVLDTGDPGRLPVVSWVGAGYDDVGGGDPTHPAALFGERRGTSLLVEHAHESFRRPGLRGHRLGDPSGAARDVAGRDWTTAFVPTSVDVGSERIVVEATEELAQLGLRTELEALAGGAVRVRHVLTNLGAAPYLLEALEVTLPLPDDAAELLDLTGRHEGERSPQRHEVSDGIWLRESRRGRPGLGSATLMVAGTRGFGFSSGNVLAVSVATSGNSVLAVERDSVSGATLSAGELLLPGEVALLQGTSYVGPWVVVAASRHGLDGAAQALHAWQRSLSAHPESQPVTLNVWEAVYFDHDEPRLRRLAELAARIGVERFVLDDGWFRGRRDDTAGLGDWYVDEVVWPQGLAPLIDHVHGLGMQFGLWFEPEMVNPDSDVFRDHPDWVLSPRGRLPRESRHQHVLDLSDPAAWTYVRDRVDDVLSTYAVDYVKWDHNRDLLEAGSPRHDGAPAGHEQTLAFHALLEDLRGRHPGVAWESCASGGGRVDLAVVEQVQRFWTSDLTDALARQHIQRWTGQLLAPEYVGAHVSAPTSHQTGRTLSLDFRAATAFFWAFGIEWDLTAATPEELTRLAEWVRLHREHRPLLHSGRVVRLESADPAVLAHGVLAADGSRAILAHVQLDESAGNRGVTLRVPGLRRSASYDVTWLGPTDLRAVSKSPPLPGGGPVGGVPVSGAELADLGLWIPRRRPETIRLMLVTEVG